MYTITVEVTFDAAHRLLCEGSKCRHNHGHTYYAWVEIGGEKLNSEDMLLDFGIIKKFVRDWINRHWDHAYLCHQDDPLLQAIKIYGLRYYTFSSNPTAEVMAQHLYEKTDSFLTETHEETISVLSVKIQETPTSSAVYRKDVYHHTHDQDGEL